MSQMSQPERVMLLEKLTPQQLRVLPHSSSQRSLAVPGLKQIEDIMRGMSIIDKDDDDDDVTEMIPMGTSVKSQFSIKSSQKPMI